LGLHGRYLDRAFGAARDSLVVRHQLSAFECRRSASGRAGNRLEQSRGMQRPSVLDDADRRRMFKSSCSRAPHGALKCEISASRRPRWVGTTGFIPTDRRRPAGVFRRGVLEAPPARAGFPGDASARAGDRRPISEGWYDRLLFGCCANETPHDASRGNSVHERRAARGPRTELHNSGCIADLGPL
jgi:hypothetical protein